MEQCHLRKLLPAPGETVSESDDAGEHLATGDRRVRPTRVACNACRQKKSACDSKRPQCTPCRRKGTECIYICKDTSETPGMALKREVESLRGRTRDLEVLLAHLSQLQGDSLRDVLVLLRTAEDPVSLLPLVQSHITTQLFGSNLEVRRELEIMARQSHHAHSSSQYSDNNSNQALQSIASTSDRNSLVSSLPPQQGPGLRARFADLRLADLDISFWSNVPVTNIYAASAISMYLETGRHFLGIFHSELFVGDLVKCRLRFCSSFLVTALLALASQKYSSVDPDAFMRSYEFEDEALRLLEVERLHDSVNTLAGLIYLYQALRTRGSVSEANEYRAAACAMAANLKLIGVKERLDSDSIQPLTDEEQHAIFCAAWGTS
ncbi:transcriptional regulatory protein GAL4 [Microdochium nivale]|nr:transcriptional regulatory protein GAL4 [Microdochium nivale]